MQIISFFCLLKHQGYKFAVFDVFRTIFSSCKFVCCFVCCIWCCTISWMGSKLTVDVCSYILHNVPPKSSVFSNGSLNHMSGMVRVRHYDCLELMCVVSVIYWCPACVVANVHRRAGYSLFLIPWCCVLMCLNVLKLMQHIANQCIHTKDMWTYASDKPYSYG